MKYNKGMDQLAADILDEDFIRIFKFLHFTQWTLGFHRVNIKYRFVTGPTRAYKWYCCFLWVMNALFTTDHIMTCDTIFVARSSVTLQLYMSIVVNGILNTTTGLRNVFYDSTHNSQLYVKLQRVDRELNYNSIGPNHKLSLLCSSLAIFTIVVNMFITSAFVLLFFIDKCTSFYFVMAFAMANCIEMIIIFAIFIFLIIRIRYVNRLLKLKKRKVTDNSKMYQEDAHKIADYDNGFTELVFSVHCILDALDDTVTLFQFPIFAFLAQLMLVNLCLIQSLIESVKEQNTVYVNLVGSNLPILVCMSTIIIILSCTAGFLMSNLRTTKMLTFSIKTYAKLGSKTRENAKQLLSILIEERCIISIYNIFVLGYQTPLKIFAITATYTIVLLQFATL